MSHFQTPQPGQKHKQAPLSRASWDLSPRLGTGKGPNSWEVSLVPQGQLLTPGVLTV